MLLFGGIAEERAHSRQLARRGGWAETARAAVGEEGSQVGGADVCQRGRSDQLTTIAAEEVDKPVSGRDIGSYRMRGATAVVLQM